MAEPNNTLSFRSHSISDAGADPYAAAKTLRLIRARARRYGRILTSVRNFKQDHGITELFGYLGGVTEHVEIHGARFNDAPPYGWRHRAGDPDGIFRPDVDTVIGRAYKAVLESWTMGPPDDIFAASGIQPKHDHHAPRTAAPDNGGLNRLNAGATRGLAQQTI